MTDYWYDEAAGDRAVEFFARFLRHQKGELAGQPFELAEWQCERIVRPLFGWKRPDGTRRYRTCYVEVGRGAGKTTLAAGVGLYLLLADNEPGAECYVGAVNREQARLTHDLAKGFIESSPALAKRVVVHRNAIVVPATKSVFKVTSSEAAGLHGLNSHAVILDECAQQPNHELYQTLHTSLGKRRQPVEFLITTAGQHLPESLGWTLHEYAAKVASGAIDDPAFLPVIYSAGDEEGLDIHSEEAWKRANPNYPMSPKPDYMAAEAKRAAEIPSAYNAFVQLHLGVWTRSVSKWIGLEKWDACRTELPDLAGRECYAGLDLSTTTDLTALVLAFPGERTWLVPHFWLPEARLRNRTDRVPYELWARQGLLSVTDGEVVDYDRIRADIVALAARYNLRELRYDPWNATQLATQLAEHDGLTLAQMRQGFVSLSAPTKELERATIGRTIAHDGNPVLRWMLGNVAVRTDPAGNVKPDKSKSAHRIDGVVAAIMALSGIMAGNNGSSVYASRGLVTI